MPVPVSLDLIEIALFQKFWWKASGNGFVVSPRRQVAGPRNQKLFFQQLPQTLRPSGCARRARNPREFGRFHIHGTLGIMAL